MNIFAPTALLTILNPRGLRKKPTGLSAALLLVIAAALFLPNCNRYTPEQEALAAEILRQRAEKDRDFKNDPNSPLLAEDREAFQGLNYYPVDLSLRFEGPIVKYDSLLPDTIIGTKGDRRPALRYGYFPFTYQGRQYRLQIYKILRDNPEYAKYLFLGFTDRTGGGETYGGGRYIDLTENAENHYVVDFNLAYNPFCAYNPRYSCAIPAAENRLPFAVNAGEKIFKKH